MWGASLMAGRAWKAGNYFDYVGWMAWGVAEGLSLGTLAIESRAAMAAARATTNVGTSTPSFIVSEGGTVFPVPKGATGPIPANSGKGIQFVGGSGGNGLSPKASGVRIMDPVTTGKYQYPGGYGSYFNSTGQTVNPLTGQTISPSNAWWHIMSK